MLPLTPEDETDTTGDPESTTIVHKVADVPIPSPGKYVIMKKYKVADSPSSTTTTTTTTNKRSATLSTTGRSFTISEKMSFQKPAASTLSSSKSVAESRPPAKKLTKGVSKKSTVHYSLYDESFIRYVNELDSYFKASELRYQSSKDTERNNTFSLANHIQYSTDASSSFDMSSGTSESAYYDGEQRSYSLDSPRHKRVVPRISLNSCNRSSIELNVLDSPKSLSENASFYTTPEQDISFITTPDYDSLSVCITPSQCTTSDQSCYLTAEQNTFDENTFVFQLNQSSSQETLFNAFSEYEDASYNSTRDHDSPLDPFSPDESATAFAALNLGFSVHENTLSSIEASREDANSDEDTPTSSRKQKMEAKIRRSNFVRSTCIDLEDDGKAEPQSTAVTLDEEETKKESYLKCCPV